VRVSPLRDWRIFQIANLHRPHRHGLTFLFCERSVADDTDP
jgi:hypothetical protein